MKKVLLILLAGVLVLGLFAAVGYTGYRLGFAQGVQTAANGDAIAPGLRLFDDFGPRGMDRFGMDRDFQRGFPMRGFGFFSPLHFLAQIAVLGLVVWFAYWLFTRSGWRLTRTPQPIETQPKPAGTEVKEETQNLEN